MLHQVTTNLTMSLATVQSKIMKLTTLNMLSTRLLVAATKDQVRLNEITIPCDYNACSTKYSNSLGANQWTGFYMITASVMKELIPTSRGDEKYTQNYPFYNYSWVYLSVCLGISGN